MPDSSKTQISIDHPNAGNAAAFLDSWKEPFILEHSNGDHYIFQSARSPIRVELFFFDSQQEAFDYGRQFLDPVNPLRIWSVNGGFLFAIEGKDEDKVADLAGHFAGEE